MFKEMIRKEKQLTTEETLAILNKGEYGMLSTIGVDGYPYGVPINYVYDNGSIYFHCASVGHKLDNLSTNYKVSFGVVNNVELMPGDFNTKFKSVIILGKAKEVFEQEKKAGLTALIHKFSSDFVREGEKYIEKAGNQTRVFRIEIEHMTGKGKE